MNRALKALFAVPLLLAACSRTGLLLWGSDGDAGDDGDAGADAGPSNECELDTDCVSDDLCVLAFCGLPTGAKLERRCETKPVDCDDHDACSLDACDSANGRCTHERPADKDMDGYVGEAPQALPPSCGGPDCDDDDQLVFPGASETCDGKDNDCNGAIDDGSLYSPAGSPVLLAPSMDRSGVSGLAFDGSAYGTVYTHTLPDHSESYFQTLNASGQVLAGPVLVSDINADTYAGALAYSGKSFLTAWSDARQASNYEIYATRFDGQANKLMPDLRLTDAPNFSKDAVLRHTGKDFILLWEDHRAEQAGGGSAIYARRLSDSGEATSDELPLTDPGEDAEFASFDVGEEHVGVAYVVAGAKLLDGTKGPTTVRFRSFDLTLGDGTPPVDLGMDGEAPRLRHVGPYFVVAWHTGDDKTNWGSSLVAATLDEVGNVLSTRSITTGDTHAKFGSLVSLGDRLLVAWQGTPTDLDRFQLFYETLSPGSLDVLVPRQLLAKSNVGGDLVGPHAVRGANGDIGVVFDDYGTYQAYFVRLACNIPK